jgi:Protein of unknown function (DUF3455)
MNCKMLLAIVSAGAAACSSGAPPGAPATSDAPQIQESNLPAPLQVPAGNKLALSLDGSGVQVYQCAKGAWSLLEPAATLSDHGKPAPVATVNQDGAVPELLLKANQTQGDGTFSRVTYVQRLRTRGGVAPSGMCPDGTQQALPYTAVYRFWTASG